MFFLFYTGLGRAGCGPDVTADSKTKRKNAMKKLKRPLSLAAAAVLCAALLTGCLSSHAQEESSSGSDASGQQTAWSEPEADQEYDAEQGKLDKDQYGSTVLAETEDAGQEYLDETLFIGDSNTVRMMAYGHTTLSNTIGVISMGIQHVPTKKCAYFTDRSGAVSIPEAVAIMQPKRIVITWSPSPMPGPMPISSSMRCPRWISCGRTPASPCRPSTPSTRPWRKWPRNWATSSWIPARL